MFSKKVLIPFLALVGVILIVAVVAFLSRSRVGEQLDIEVRGPQQVFLGVPFNLTVGITNTSKSVLHDSRLTLTLPEGAVFVGESPQKTSDFRELGSIGSGGFLDETFRLMIIDGENTIRRINAALSYSPETIGARFEKSTDFDISVGKAALSLDLVAPQKILSGENFGLGVSYVNNANISFSDLKLRLEYPPTFKFESATLEPDENNSVWYLGALHSGSKNDFSISGTIIGPDNSFFEIRGFIEASFEGETYVISKNKATISISPSPLSLKVFLNNSSNFIASLGDRLSYDLVYTNNTDVALRDVIVTAQMTGEMFDLFTITSSAIFRSVDNTLIWNAGTTPDLSLVGPGESGSVKFSVRLKDAYPIRRLGDRNFNLKVNAQIESPTVPYFLAANRTVGLAQIETKVAGAINLQSKVFFRDATSGIINEGPMPPQADRPTQYSVHWIITNFSTDVSDVEVRAFLEGNTNFLRVVKSNVDSVPIYNPRTQEIVWRIDQISPTRGVITEPVEAVFQIESTPAITMINEYAPLMRNIVARATDMFTGLPLQAKTEDENTRLPDDPTVVSRGGAVIP
jgi:hypothetical protein